MNTPNVRDVLTNMLDHVNGGCATALPDLERTPAPWESSMQATCECLSWRGSLDNQDRRRMEDELGESLYAEFPVHARSALAVAHSLLDKGVVTQDELGAKMKEIRARLEKV